MARILTLTNWYPPHHFGGYEIECYDVMHGLHERGHDVQVLCSNQVVPGAPADETSPFAVHRRLAMYWRDGWPWRPTAREQLAIERSNQRDLQELLDRFEPEVVSVWQLSALSLNLLTTIQRRGIPMLYSICDEWLTYGIGLDPWSRTWYPNPLRRGVGRLAQRFLGTPAVLSDLGNGGCFCFNSRFTREVARAASPWGYPVDPIVYPGIDRTLFAPTARADPKPWGWRLLFVGRLDSRKGTDTLLRALAKLPPEATLTFVARGEASEKARLEQLAADLGVVDRVRIESISRAELPDAYASHDCFIFPSEWPEPFGMVPIEAMACGTPVVATGVGGSGEFSADGVNCLLFTPGDEVALADAVTRLATEPDLRATLQAHGYVTADHFDLATTIAAYEICHVATAERRLSTLRLPPHPSAGSVPEPPAPEPRAIDITDRTDGPVLHIGTAPHEGGAIQLVSPVQRAWQGQPSVIGDPANLPFADAVFAGVVCQDTIGRVDDDRALAKELARVTRPQGTVALVTPNAHNASRMRRRLHNWWRGWHNTYEPGQRRTYSWAEVEALLAADFVVTARRPLGWGDSPRRRLATKALVGPLHEVSHSILIEATPKS